MVEPIMNLGISKDNAFDSKQFGPQINQLHFQPMHFTRRRAHRKCIQSKRYDMKKKINSNNTNGAAFNIRIQVKTNNNNNIMIHFEVFHFE